MNNYDWIRPRHRHRQLIIVEGRHEKNELMQLLKKCFPEIEVEFIDIIIYATNIYGLYHEIEENYDERWEETEIDLPYIISKKKGGMYFQNMSSLAFCCFLIMNVMNQIFLKKRL